jgi:hypothetical protein
MAGKRPPIDDRMRIVGYALARASAGGHRPPPEWLGVFTWTEAYQLFYPALGAGRSPTAFRHTLQHLRDEFGALMPGWRSGWAFTSGRPPLSKAAEAFARRHVHSTDAALRAAIAPFLPQGSLRAA